MGSLAEINQSLQLGEGVIKALQNLNALLEAEPSSSYALEVSQTIQLPLLFSFLQSTKQDEVNYACSVLDKLFTSFSASILVDYGQYIELGLQHTEVEVKIMCVRVLTKHSNDPAVVAMVCAPTLFHLLTLIIGEEDLKCAKLASDLLSKFLVSPGELNDQVMESFLLDTQMMMGRNDIVRYRVYELAVQMLLHGDEKGAVFVKSSGLLEKLVGELEVEDILVKLNAIELLSQLIDSSEGTVFLETQKVLGKMHSLLVSSRKDPFGSIVIPGLLKFFGHTSLQKSTDLPAVCSQYPEFLQLVFQTVHTPHEITLWGVAMDTLGVLGSSLSGRKVLLCSETEMTSALQFIGECVVSAASDVRIRALRAIAMLLSCEQEVREWDSSTSRKWFNTLHTNMLPTMMSIAKQPFTDLRLAGLGVLLAMAPFEWGQREFHSHPGFLEYLIDRKTENTKEGKEMKYNIVHSIAVSDYAEKVFDSPELLKLKQYDREGPFFYTADTTIAFDGST